MSRECCNRVEIHGGKEEIERFRMFVKGYRRFFDFEKILPTPSEEELDKELIVYPRDLRRDKWRKINWGTDSHAFKGIILIDEAYCVAYHFITSATPASGIYLELRKIFPNLNISWRYYHHDSCGYSHGCDDPPIKDGYLENDFSEVQPIAQNHLGCLETDDIPF
ncbi:hypothetical protein ACFLQ0_04480 [Nitrospinota bacterium]